MCVLFHMNLNPLYAGKFSIVPYKTQRALHEYKHILEAVKNT
jgi:hypothetical protein